MMIRTIAGMITLASLTLADVGKVYADFSGTKETRTVPIGNKLTTELRRQIPKEPYALTGDLQRSGYESPADCSSEPRPIGNKLTTYFRDC